MPFNSLPVEVIRHIVSHAADGVTVADMHRGHELSRRERASLRVLSRVNSELRQLAGELLWHVSCLPTRKIARTAVIVLTALPQRVELPARPGLVRKFAPIVKGRVGFIKVSAVTSRTGVCPLFR